MSNIKVILLSMLLGIGTLLLISLSNELPFSHARDAITDALSLPGGLIAAIFYPEGVHTGSGTAAWAWVAIAANAAFYTLVWFVLIKIFLGRRSKVKG
jgi:hypothetical protein